MFCSYRRIKRLFINNVTYWVGSRYSDALHKAVDENNEKTIQALIADGFYVDSLAPASFDNKLCKQELMPKEITPLLLAIRKGSLNIVKFLLENGADPNRKDTNKESSWTPLHYALYYNKSDIAKYLIEKCEVAIDEEALNIVKKQKLIDVPPIIRKKYQELEAINWYCHEKKIEAKGFKSCASSSPYLPYYSSSDPLYDFIAMRALKYCILNNDNVEGLLQFKEYFKEDINLKLYDIVAHEISNNIKEKFPELCNHLISDSHDIDGGVYSYITAPNSRKAPILFLAILSGNLAITNLLIENGADIYATVNKLSAKDLMEKIFSEQLSKESLNQFEVRPTSW